jgi:hypothetical protein
VKIGEEYPALCRSPAAHSHHWSLSMFALLLAAALAAPDGSGAGPVFDVHGRPVDPGFFPVAVWLQDPRNAVRYKQAGINMYVALWKGPTAVQFATLRAAGMPVICDQNRFALAHKNDPTIAAWMHGDEPDNAQEVTDPKTGRRGYGPPVKPSRIEADYHRIHDADPSRPVMLNLGQGVANDAWKGRGSGASLDDYPGYIKGADVVSFDVYPVVGLERPDGADFLWYVAKGVDRLVKWTAGAKPVWSCIECTHISEPSRKATPKQVRAEVWMALTHGAGGLIYFVHEFQPKFNEHALLDDPEMLAGVTEINRQIRELSRVLNSPTVAGAVEVKSSTADVPISTMVKRSGGDTYLFAVGMRNASTRGTFTLKGLPRDAKAEVQGENREVPVRDGTFEDAFAPYDVHIYRIKGSE